MIPPSLPWLQGGLHALLTVDIFAWRELFLFLGAQRLAPLRPNLGLDARFLDQPAPLVRAAQRYCRGFQNLGGAWSDPLRGTAPLVEGDSVAERFGNLLDLILGEIAQDYGADALAVFERWAWLHFTKHQQVVRLAFWSEEFARIGRTGTVADPGEVLDPALQHIILTATQAWFRPDTRAEVERRVGRAFAEPPSLFERAMFQRFERACHPGHRVGEWGYFMGKRSGVTRKMMQSLALNVWADLPDRVAPSERRHVAKWARAAFDQSQFADGALGIPYVK